MSAAPPARDADGLPVRRAPADGGWWEVVTGAPDPRLRGLVRDYQGYVARAAGALRQRQLPSGDVTLIVNLGAPLRVVEPGAGPGAPPRATAYESFVAGLHDAWAETETAGALCGVEVRLTPLGAYRLLGGGLAEAAGRVVSLRDLCGAAAAELAPRLHDARGWAARFALLDAHFVRRAAAAPAVDAAVAHAWARLRATHGGVAVGALAAEAGWSRQHLAARFAAQVGVPPRTAARLLRFERAVRLLDAAPRVRWAEIALRSGYYDQAHLVRDVRRLAGETPTALQRRRRPETLAAG